MPLNSQLIPPLVSLPSSTPGRKVVFARATVFFNGIGYCSLSEAVCGTLLELFVPGFSIKEGETFQIPLGQGSSVDFMVHGILVEYHGLRFQPERRKFGDFAGRKEYRQYAKRMRQLRRNKWKRQEFLAEVRGQLTDNYYDKRRRLIDKSDEHKGRELIVATSCDEFFELVVMRFNQYFCPTRAEFRAIFYSLVKVVAQENGPDAKRDQEKIRA